MSENRIELLTIPEASKKLRIPYRALLDSVNDGQISSFKIGNSRRFVDLADVINSMKSNGGTDGTN